MATSLAQLLGLAGPKLLPLIRAGAPAVKESAPGELAQARAAAQAPSVLPRVGTVTAEPEYLPPDAAMGGAPALLPAVGGALPRVTNPLQDQIERQQALVNKDLTPQTPFHDLSGWGKVGRVLGTIGGATRFAPYIPGTQENRLMRTSADMGALNQLTGLEDKAETQARGEEEVGLQREAGTRSEQQLHAQLAENGLQMDTAGNIMPLPSGQWSPKLRADLLPKTPDEAFIREHPDASAQQFQQFSQKPLSAEQAAALNQVWNGIATQYHLPQNQFREGMASADAQAMQGSFNNVISRAQGGQKIVVEAGQQGNARSDKSFQYNNGELDKLSTPITQLRQRMGNLQTSLGQNTTQSLSFVAPEMLSVLAGGQGSGLRMNEAEIARIVGGRSQWESLKGNLQTWSTDPAHASPLPPDQVAQMRALVSAVNQRISAKSEVLDDAYGSLLETDDIREQRKIVSDTRQRINDVDDHGYYVGQKIPGKGTVVGFAANGNVQVDDAR